MLLLDRPFRPRPPPNQAAEDQQAAPKETQEQGEGKQTETSDGPQTNGETDDGKQRRQPRRRRQRNSESSTSKVSQLKCIVVGCYTN